MKEIIDPPDDEIEDQDENNDRDFELEEECIESTEDLEDKIDRVFSKMEKRFGGSFD